MKKAISVLTSIMLVMLMGIGTITFAAESNQMKWYVGDVNRDGQVNAVDASIILQHYALTSTGLPSKIYEVAADVNHDGQINAVDASIVLSYYAASATGRVVEYELIVEENENNPKQFGKNDLVEFSGTSWYIHSTMELSETNLYPKKEFLTNKEIFAISNKYENNWYGIYLDNTKTEVYILITPASLDYFNKVGKVELIDQIATETIPAVVTTTTTSATTTSTTTTSTTTTSTSSATTQAVSSTTTTTSSVVTSTTSETTTQSQTTTQIITKISCTSITKETPKYSNWECVEFNGEWWNVRSTTELKVDNTINHLSNKEIFYIKRNVTDDWYEICSMNAEESGSYIKIAPENEYLFTPVKVLGNYYFIGDSWNVRTSKDLSSDNNIVGTLRFGDIISVVEFYEDGWAKVLCNRASGQTVEVYVVLQPFIRLS